MNFVPAVAYHFCLNLPAAFSQPKNGLIVEQRTHELLNCLGEFGYGGRKSKQIESEKIGANYKVTLLPQTWIGKMHGPPV